MNDWPSLDDEEREETKEEPKEEVIKPPTGHLSVQSWIGPFKGLETLLKQMGATDLKNAVDQRRWEIQQEEDKKK